MNYKTEIRTHKVPHVYKKQLADNTSSISASLSHPQNLTVLIFEEIPKLIIQTKQYSLRTTRTCSCKLQTKCSRAELLFYKYRCHTRTTIFKTVAIYSYSCFQSSLSGTEFPNFLLSIIHSIRRNSGSRSCIVWKITSNIYILHRFLPEAWFQRSPLIGNPLVKVKREMDRSQEWRTEVLPATRLRDHHPLSSPFSLFCVALQRRWELLSSSREEFSSLVVNDRARINLAPPLTRFNWTCTRASRLVRDMNGRIITGDPRDDNVAVA